MRFTVPIFAAIAIASSRASPIPEEPTTAAEDGLDAAAGLPPKENPHTLYVKGLPQPCTDEELRGLWWEDIRSKNTKTRIPVHPNGQNKDYGCVEFGTEEDMQAALSNNADSLKGIPLNVRSSTPIPETTIPEGARGGFGRGVARGAGRGRRGGLVGRSDEDGRSIEDGRSDEDDYQTTAEPGSRGRGRGRGGRGGGRGGRGGRGASR